MQILTGRRTAGPTTHARLGGVRGATGRTGVRRALTGCAAVLFAAGALTACGADSGSAGDSTASEDVASLDGSSGEPDEESGASGPAATDEGRPQIRLDSTDAEVAQQWKPYNLCLKKNGVRMYPGRGLSPDQNDHSARAEAARETCAGRMPLQPPELDRNKNPDYAEQFHDYVNCLNENGLKVKPLPDASGWNYAGKSTLSETERHEVDRTCKTETFSVAQG